MNNKVARFELIKTPDDLEKVRESFRAMCSKIDICLECPLYDAMLKESGPHRCQTAYLNEKVNVDYILEYPKEYGRWLGVPPVMRVDPPCNYGLTEIELDASKLDQPVIKLS